MSEEALSKWRWSAVSDVHVPEQVAMEKRTTRMACHLRSGARKGGGGGAKCGAGYATGVVGLGYNGVEAVLVPKLSLSPSLHIWSGQMMYSHRTLQYMEYFYPRIFLSPSTLDPGTD